MNTALPLLRDFSDRFSPIVVKELRQGLRTRFFTSALILFHALIILLLCTATLGAPVEAVNGIFWGIAGFMLLVVMPLRGFSSLHTETTDGTLDMLTLTSIPSFRILYGKWAALYSQSLLVAGSILPYMVARYFFGGVEILREAVALVMLGLGSGIITAGLLAFSAQTPVLLRIFLAVGIGAGAMPLGFFTAFLVSTSQADSLVREFFALARWEQCSLVGGILALSVYVVYYFLALGSSRIAPPSENHSTRKRLVAFFAHGVLMTAGLLLAFFNKDADVAMFAYVPLMFMTLIVCMDVMTEDMPRFPTAVSAIAQRGRLVRLTGRILHPGWASGVWFSALLCAMPLCIMAAVTYRHSSWDWDRGPFFYMFCIFLAAFVPVTLRFNRTNLFINWWVVQLSMLTLSLFLAMFCGVMGDPSLAVIGVVTPTSTLLATNILSWDQRDGFVLTGAGFSALWLLAALIRSWLNFSIYTRLERES
ncbi:MAG: hypothetical protein B7Z47_02900, partial [Chthoniobacter sp. 12-60-6]